MLKQWLNGIVELLFPRECVCCGEWLISHEEGFCLMCNLQLPRTNYLLTNKNPVAEVLYGRIPIKYAACFLLLSNTNSTHKIIHAIKYKGDKSLAYHLGNMYASEIQLLQPTITFDIIVPVPLHPKKLKQRGYNQAEEFATGLSSIWKASYVKNAVIRKFYTQTQTKKNRLNRWKNVAEIFECEDNTITNKHILLVDDVITTGATIEACCIALLNLNPASISVITIAMTKN